MPPEGDRNIPGQADWPREWAKELTGIVAGQIRHYRETLTPKLTVTALAKRTGIARPVLSNLLNGDRESVSVAEILILAAALEVSPLALLIPRGESGVEILPGRDMPTDSAVQWLSGYLGTNRDVIPALWLHGNARRACEEGFSALRTDLDNNIAGEGHSHTDPAATRASGGRLQSAIGALAGLRDAMRERGETPPLLDLPLALLDRPDGLDLVRAEATRLEERAIAAIDIESAPPDLRVEMEERIRERRAATLERFRASQLADERADPET